MSNWTLFVFVMLGVASSVWLFGFAATRSAKDGLTFLGWWTAAIPGPIAVGMGLLWLLHNAFGIF